MNILIVDDISLVRIKLEKMLSSEGFDVFEADSISPVTQNTFSRKVGLSDIDLALIDIYLKGENGFKLLQYLSENHPHIQSIIISAEARESLVKRAVKLGAKSFLTKPFDKKTLLEKINATAASRAKTAKTERKINGFAHKNDVNSLKTAVSLEVSRTVRSKNSFSLVKITYDSGVEQEKIRSFKSHITANIRDIDRLFYTDDFEYTFLLPLTDKKGREIFSERIISEIKEKIENGEEFIKQKSATFPEDIVSKEELQYNKHDHYVNSLFAKI